MTIMFIFLGKLTITFLSCFTCIGIMKNITSESLQVNSYTGPLVIVGSTSYILSSIFLGVFEVAVTGLLMALAVDKDANMGEP